MNPRSKSNPFARSERYWKVTFLVPQVAAATASEAFDDIALAVSSFETDEKNNIWTFELLFEAAPNMAEIQRRVMVLCKLYGIAAPKLQTQEVEQKDWLSQVAKDFPPIAIGRFYVHGSHVSSAPVGSLAIRVDAGAAFGSGEHGTTSRCLEAIDWLGKKRQFVNILDMGCGSGILAIAAAKLWKMPVLAADIDPVAVRVTEDNVKLNRVQANVTSIVSDGYNADRLRRAAPFDLIVSNILARPLIAFAPDLAKNLAPHGIAVLSGLLKSQETQVLSAHLAQGLKLSRRFIAGEWSTLVITR